MNDEYHTKLLEAVLLFGVRTVQAINAYEESKDSPKWRKADSLRDKAQIALWNLLGDGEAAMVGGKVYVKEPNMRISVHRVIQLDEV